MRHYVSEKDTMVGSAGGQDTFLYRVMQIPVTWRLSRGLVDWALILQEGLTGICEMSGHKALTLGMQVLGAHRSVSTRPSNTCRRPCLDALAAPPGIREGKVETDLNLGVRVPWDGSFEACTSEGSRQDAREESRQDGTLGRRDLWRGSLVIETCT